MEANNSSRAEVAEEVKPTVVRKADGCLEDPKGLFQQPTAEEVSRLAFGKLRDYRVYVQEARNNFAHLLNRGSCLE